jgi:transposase
MCSCFGASVASADMTPPAVWFSYTPDCKGMHPQEHLSTFNGTLQADAYGDYQAIYETGRVTEAACWAHARRQFYELHAARPNALNTGALERIGALYQVEELIRGKPPDERRAYRQEHARPLLDQLHAWLTATLETLSRKSDTSRAILYALNRWKALTRYCDDGHWRSITYQSSAPCAVWPSEDGTTCSPVPTQVVNVRQPFTA